MGVEIPETIIQSRRPRLRFSLLTLLLLTTIVALGLALWQVGSEVVPLREEVRKLRMEAGDLIVEDESKLCAVQVHTDSYLTWKWRIWIPLGKQYRLQCISGRVARNGFVFEEGSTSNLYDSGEFWVAYRIRRDPIDEKWYGSIAMEGRGAGKRLHEWVEWKSISTKTTGVGHLTVVHDSDRPFELIRHRVMKSSISDTGTSNDIAGPPSPGFHIWLEPM